MSSLVYGIVTAKRVVAPKEKSKTTSAPGMGTYLDALTALVPAEALALYAGILIPYATHTATSAGGKKITAISNPGLLVGGVAGLLALSGLLYAVGRKAESVHHWDVLRFFVPPMAFAAWSLVQTPSVWDVWWPGSTIGERVTIAAFAAVVLSIVAHSLGNQADRTPGVLAVTDVSPRTGPVAGGQDVTVTGTGFTNASLVQFGDSAGLKMAVDGDTQLTVTSPKTQHAETVDVTVTVAGRKSAKTRHDRYRYAEAAEHAAPPTVTGVDPPGGPTAGGGTVTVTGTGLTGATKVTFGAIAVTNPAVASDTELTVTSPPAVAAGPVDVTVTTPAGTSATTTGDHYTYAAAPIVTNVAPGRGPLGGGQEVTVTGTGFTGASRVSFGATAVTNPTGAGDTKLTVTSPPGAAGTVAVTVTTPAGTSATTPSDHYTYAAAPAVTGVSPSNGPLIGGDTVTVTGSGFTGATQVSFGATAATILTPGSDTELTVKSPRGAAPGPVDVTVTAPTGVSAATEQDHYTYTASEG